MATHNHIAMTKELLNVKMYSIKDCQEVIDEIVNEFREIQLIRVNTVDILYGRIIQRLRLDHGVLVALVTPAHHQAKANKADRYRNQGRQRQPPVNAQHIAEDHERDDNV